jgi:serine/threonine protein kinase
MAYMAPEQIMGKARAASDQYALGIMICHEPLPEGEGLVSTLYRNSTT